MLRNWQFWAENGDLGIVVFDSFGKQNSASLQHCQSNSKQHIFTILFVIPLLVFVLQAGKIWTKSNCPNFMKLWSFGEKAWTFFKTAGDAILDIFPDVKLLANASLYLKYSSPYVCQKLWYSVMSKWTKTSSEHEIPPSRFERTPVPLTSIIHFV